VSRKYAQNLSKNNLGHEGAVAVGELLENDNDLLYLDLSGKEYIISVRIPYKLVPGLRSHMFPGSRGHEITGSVNSVESA